MDHAEERSGRTLLGLVSFVGVMLLAGCRDGGALRRTSPPDVEERVEVTLSIGPDDSRLRYVGRWDRTDPALPRVGWQGACVEFRFDGSAASVQLTVASATEYFRVIVDGDRAAGTRFAALSGTASYELATGLEPGVHTIELVKETDAGSGVTFGELTLQGIALLDPPPAATRRLVFYGDSGLAGDSLSSERNASGWSSVGCDLGYAGVAARAFGADYQNISLSGATLADMTTLYDRRFRKDTAPSYDFAEFVADAVIVDLGSNDIYEVGKTKVKRRFVDLLDLLRVVHPDAHLVLFCSRGWSKREPANYNDEVVASYGDPNVSAATFPWFFEQWHGCEYDHAGAAEYLVAHLTATLGWEAVPLDVMSGFGRDGDVANGGFEAIAPFGGYGWRYLDDPGVARVVDEPTAHEGSAYLRLEAGGTVHQPNPASGRQVVTATVWMRGAFPGARADVTIDFRDQEQGTAPLERATTSFDLTTEWASYTASATAPVVPTNPVFHTRLTLTATSGTVDVDGVTMRTE